MFEFDFKLWLLLMACILAIFTVSAFNAAAYGRSVEDLAGVFSIQKTIKLGSSSECFGGAQNAADPLSQKNIALADNQPPGLAGFSMDSEALKNSSFARSLNLTAHVIDDQSGLAGGGKSNLSTAWFVSHSGKQTIGATFDPSNLITGNKLDGFYSSKIILPDNSETGAWHLDNFTLIDEQGNRRTVGRDEMLRLGYPADFLVT